MDSQNFFIAPEHRYVQLLTRYKSWADEKTYEMVCQQSESELLKERETTFKTISHTLHHTYIVDDIFRAHIEGREHGYTARTIETPSPVSALHQRVRALNAWWITFSDNIADEDLEKPLEFKFIGGAAGSMTYQEIIFHIVQHATYHRGYVDDMMYQIPVTPPSTDLPVFLQQHKNPPMGAVAS